MSSTATALRQMRSLQVEKDKNWTHCRAIPQRGKRVDKNVAIKFFKEQHRDTWSYAKTSFHLDFRWLCL